MSVLGGERNGFRIRFIRQYERSRYKNQLLIAGPQVPSSSGLAFLSCSALLLPSPACPTSRPEIASSSLDVRCTVFAAGVWMRTA